MRPGGPLGSAALALLIGASLPARAQPAPAPAPAPAAPPPPAAQPEPPLPPISDARPAPLPDLEPAPIPWHNHLEVGGGFALAELPAHKDGLGAATPLRFKPGAGFHLDLSWQMLKYLRFTGYMSEHEHGMDFPAGSLVPQNVDSSSAHVYSFGVRVSPTLPLGKRVRLWATGGVGWGRIEYGRLTTEGPAPYQIYERSESFFEIPLGLGGSVELIPRWLSLRIELTGSYVPSQIGDALAPGGQAISNGSIINVKTMPQIDAYFLQTIGLSLHL